MRVPAGLLIGLAVVVMAGGADQAPSKWRGWDSYQVILWSVGRPFNPASWTARVKEAGFTAVPAEPGADPPAGIAFYLENLAPELGFHHRRRPLYDSDRNQYLRTTDKSHLTRKPCFDDPAFWATVTPRLDAAARQNTARRPLLYNLRDEPSTGLSTNPMDYCFCPYTLRAFRAWLKTRYASLAAAERRVGNQLRELGRRRPHDYVRDQSA